MPKNIKYQIKDGFDRLRLNGKTYYALGEYRNDAVGYKFAKEMANKIRANGISARIIKRKTGYQVYTPSKSAASIDARIPITPRVRREFVDKRGKHWFDDGFEIWQDDQTGDEEPFNDRDPRYIDNW
jgi:hypothetical protein